YRNEGPMAKGDAGNLGPSAVLDTGRCEIAVISRHTEPYDMGSFRALGIDPASKRYVRLKSRGHWRVARGARDAQEGRAGMRGAPGLYIAVVTAHVSQRAAASVYARRGGASIEEG